ncbi:unnamed protein product, partial [Brassica rapa subsp. trilocularis]
IHELVQSPTQICMPTSGFNFLIIRNSNSQKLNKKLYQLDCPGPLAETAGKSESCADCPNQQACATGTAPTGPDPGSNLPCDN